MQSIPSRKTSKQGDAWVPMSIGSGQQPRSQHRARDPKVGPSAPWAVLGSVTPSGYRLRIVEFHRGTSRRPQAQMFTSRISPKEERQTPQENKLDQYDALSSQQTVCVIKIEPLFTICHPSNSLDSTTGVVLYACTTGCETNINSTNDCGLPQMPNSFHRCLRSSL